MIPMAVLVAVFVATYGGVDNMLVAAVLARVLAVLWLIDAAPEREDSQRHTLVRRAS